jgi:3-hydroxyisobutyrate dehydrogenase
MLRSSCCRLSTFGFIGLGQMGSRMAVNVLKDASVTQLVVYDTSAKAVDEVRAAATEQFGAARAAAVRGVATVREVGLASDTVLTMLPNGKIVSAVYDELFASLKPGAFLLDSSTIDVATARAVGAKAVQHKARAFCDAPVSGGVVGAKAGTLTFMVGADGADTFAEATKRLQPMAKNIVHCGATGSGQVVKLCNNLVLAQHMVAVSEAMLMGTRLGVDGKTLAAVINTSTGKCWSSEVNNPFPGAIATAPAGRGYTGGFAAALMHKDLGLAIDAARSVGVSTAGADTSMALFNAVLAANDGDKDFSGVIRTIEAKSGKKP